MPTKSNGQGPPKHGNTPAGRAPSGAGPHGPATTDQPLSAQHAGWGNLPPRLRGALSNGLQQRLSQLYQALTHDDDKNLAHSSHPPSSPSHHPHNPLITPPRLLPLPYPPVIALAPHATPPATPRAPTFQEITPASRKAVAKGLAALAAMQAPDGSWGAPQFR